MSPTNVIVQRSDIDLTSGLSVLVIEDNPADAALVREHLELGSGPRVEVLVVPRLSDGLARLAQGTVDCVLVDLSLPDAERLEAVSALLAVPSGPPVIVLTGLNDGSIGRDAVALGAQDFLVKAALDTDSLERSVRYAIERHRNLLALSDAYSRVIREVAQREFAEQTLRLRERRIAALVEHISDVIAVIGPDGALRSASSAAARLLGWDVPAMLGTDVFDRVHPEDQADVRQALASSVAQGGAATAPLELRLARADGSWLASEIVASNRLDDPAVGGIILSVRDISRRLEAETALRHSEEQHRRIVELAKEGIMSVDVEGVNTFVNPSMADMLGYTVEEMTGASVFDFMDEHASIAYREIRRETFRDVTDWKFQHRNGAEVWTSLATTALADLDGNHIGVLMMVSDVTHRLRQEQTLREAKARFEQAFASAPIGIALVDLDGILLEANPALVEMLALRSNETAVGLLDLVVVDQRDSLSGQLSALAAGERQGVHAEYQLRSVDGGELWVRLALAVIDDRSARRYAVCHMENVTAHKRAEETLIFRGLHDALTGLPNRALLQDRLEQALCRRDRADDATAVLFIDVDRFKLVNDSLGHGAGDELLIEISRRVAAATRATDTVARLGGDEFIVVLDGLSGRDEVVEIVDRIRAAVAQPVRLGDADLVPSISIGVTFASRLHRAPELLLQEADSAMDRAKELGRNRFEVFEGAMRGMAMAHLGTESTLRSALAQAGLRLVYQPIVELATGRVRGAEALLRIDDPDRGFLVPAQFLQVAEDTGLIVPIGLWAFEEASRKAQAWQRFADGGPFQVAVNLSARQLGVPGLVEQARKAFGEGRIEPGSVCLELTETALIAAASSAITTLGFLKQLGLELALDDFGTGFASLTYLRQFPVDVLKIARQFVSGLGASDEDEAIVRAILGLGAALGLRVVAEGVETARQHDLLVELGAKEAQGYWYACPLPEDEFEVTVAHRLS